MSVGPFGPRFGGLPAGRGPSPGEAPEPSGTDRVPAVTAPRSRARPATAGETRFPDEVMVALHEAGVTLGCLPVRIDGDDWRAALFHVVPDRAECLSIDPTLSGAPFAVALEADLHEHENATVIELAIEIRTPGVPLAGSVLFLTGHVAAHFESVALLATQTDIPLFIGDAYCRQLASQRIPIGDAERAVFKALLDEAVGRDAVIRLTGRYDPAAAFDAVLGATMTARGAQAMPASTTASDGSVPAAPPDRVQA